MNAVIYARYSSLGQKEQSIEGQLKFNNDFAEREGYSVVGEYIDRATTGRNDDRPDFQRMIKDAKKGLFKYIIVWKLDRFARNRFDSATYKNELKKYGVRVISATERISELPEGIILEGMLETVAEYFSANLAKDVKRGMNTGAESGKHMGGTTPFGFKVSGGRLVADEINAPAFRYFAERYADGMRQGDIIEEMHAAGFRDKHDEPFTVKCFAGTLRNRKCIGEYVRDGIVVPNGCDALIDAELFDRVQARIATNRRAPAAAKAKVDYVLHGKVFCGPCGSRMIGESGRGKGGVVYNYYTCAARKKDHTCSKKNEKKDFLEWYIVEQTVEYVLRPDRMDYIAERVVKAYDSEFNNEKLKELERLIQKFETDIQKAVDASLEAPKSARERYYTKIESLEARKHDAELDLVKFRIANSIRYTKEEVMAWMKQFCAGDALDPDFQCQIVDVFVNSVYVFDDKVVVYYNVKGGKQVSYIEMLDSTEEPPGQDDQETSGVRICNDMVYHNPSRKRRICYLSIKIQAIIAP